MVLVARLSSAGGVARAPLRMLQPSAAVRWGWRRTHENVKLYPLGPYVRNVPTSRTLAFLAATFMK